MPFRFINKMQLSYARQSTAGKKNGGERVGFSQPPVELKLALQDSLFQEVIL